jgi:hypothetical protein
MTEQAVGLVLCRERPIGAAKARSSRFWPAWQPQRKHRLFALTGLRFGRFTVRKIRGRCAPVRTGSIAITPAARVHLVGPGHETHRDKHMLDIAGPSRSPVRQSA